MIRQALVAGSLLVLVAAVPAAAQRPAAPSSDDQQLRNQVQKFEVVLQVAVRQGGDAFARQRKDAIPPGVQLTSEDPQVKGFAPPEGGGLFFYVSVPSIRIGINQLLLQVESLAARQQQRTDRMQPAAGRGVNPGGPVSAQGLLAPPDPMTASPVVDEGTCAGRTKPSKGYSNPDYEYAVAVCDALMDAMLDGPGPLPIKENEWLTVAAVSGDPAPPGLINTSSDYVTYLQIKGSDLLAYRQGKITKEDARRLVEMKQR